MKEMSPLLFVESGSWGIPPVFQRPMRVWVEFLGWSGSPRVGHLRSFGGCPPSVVYGRVREDQSAWS